MKEDEGTKPGGDKATEPAAPSAANSDATTSPASLHPSAFILHPYLTRPLDVLNIAFVTLLLLLSVGCLAAGRLRDARALPVEFAGLLAGAMVVAHLARNGYRDRTLLGVGLDFYPLLLVPLVYDRLGILIPALNPVEKDSWLIAIDRAMFGLDPAVWLQRFITPWLTDLLYLAYATFFVFQLAIGLVVYLRSPALQAVYLPRNAYLLPVLRRISACARRGPRATMGARLAPVQVTALSRGIAHTLDHLEQNRVDVFPSGHVLVTAVCMMFAARHAKRLFIVLLPVAILLVASTIYCRYHYVIDVLTSFAIAPFLPGLAEKLYRG